MNCLVSGYIWKVQMMEFADGINVFGRLRRKGRVAE